MSKYAEKSRGVYNRRYDSLNYEESKMGITASSESGDFEKFMFEPKRYDAVCFQVVDLGTHTNEWQGKKTRARKCLIGFEVPSEMMEIEGKDGTMLSMPRVLSRQLTISLSEKSNMLPLLVSWRGRDFTPEEEVAFDISKLMGCTCELQIINKNSKKTGKPYNFIQNILSPRDGVKKVTPQTPELYFSFEDNTDVPDMPDWIRGIIEESEEWMDINIGQPDAEDAAQEEPPPQGDEDDIPF
jgi:hypothetical protein